MIEDMSDAAQHVPSDAEKAKKKDFSYDGMRVLVVDNDKSHAQAMKETLTRVGYPVDLATSGPEGAPLIEQGDYDIVITDLMMNEIDGMQILSRCREVLPMAQVIMVTGHATVPKAVEAMQLGAFNFLEKPLNTDRLRTITEKAANRLSATSKRTFASPPR